MNELFSKKAFTLFSFALLLLSVVIVDVSALGAFFYSSLLVLVLNRMLGFDERSRIANFNVFVLYSFGVLILYSSYKFIDPSLHGMTPEGFEGADDKKFYGALSADRTWVPYTSSYLNFYKDHSFVLFLRLLYPFEVNDPLQILLVNGLGIVFIPYYTYQLAREFFNDKVASKAWVFVLLGPLLLGNGLILVRDGWIATLFIAGLYYLVRYKVLGFFICLGMLTFLRVGSGGLLLISTLIYIVMFKSEVLLKRNFQYVGLLVLVILVVTPFVLDDILVALAQKGVGLLGRENFGNENTLYFSGSMIGKIYSLSFAPRVFLSSIFFFFLPYFDLNVLLNDTLDLRRILTLVIMPLAFVYYFKLMFKGFGFAVTRKDRNMIFIIIVIVTLIALTAEFSRQVRHKTMVMPLFYIAAAYGFYYGSSSSRILGWLVAGAYLGLQMYMLI